MYNSLLISLVLALSLLLPACASAPSGVIDASADRYLGVACNDEARVLRAELLTQTLEDHYPDIDSTALRDALALMRGALSPDSMNSAASAYRWALVDFSREVFSRSDSGLASVEGLHRMVDQSPRLARQVATIRARVETLCAEAAV